ncbi:MAG: hypothetical protein DRP65_01445 [Planctomycetota bacterium]|nr:MAG: hypothetical protein DRP65_01445 [Planctomycetota bacterium]
MKKIIAQCIALLSLVLLIAPSLLLLMNQIELERVKSVMLIATIIWFASATVWMWKENAS